MADVSTPSKLVTAMQTDWSLAAALLGGTETMRAAATKYLPQWPNEGNDSYKARLGTSVLFPAYKRTIETLTGRPFSKPVTLGADIPAQIAEWLDDVDLEGRNIGAFAADVMENALGYGLSGILVDYPIKPDGVVTLADEQAVQLRPYFVHIKPEQLLGWVAARVGGKWTIEQLRLMETVEEPDGAFGITEVQQIRVLEPGKWSTYRKNANRIEGWSLFESGMNTLKAVPFVPVYGDRMGFMVGKPPLLELAYMNVEHWQSASDQRNILHVARVPILVLTGVDDEKYQLTVGGAAAVNLPLHASLQYVEHSGAAIGAGVTDLANLEERMRQAGAELLVVRPTAVTPTEVNAESMVGMCALQRITNDLQDSLNKALQCMADWSNLPTGGSVKIFQDFASAYLSDISSQLIVTAVQSGLISRETGIVELKRRGMLAADVDPATEAQKIESQGPSLGAMGGVGEGAQGPMIKGGAGVATGSQDAQDAQL